VKLNVSYLLGLESAVRLERGTAIRSGRTLGSAQTLKRWSLFMSIHQLADTRDLERCGCRDHSGRLRPGMLGNGDFDGIELEWFINSRIDDVARMNSGFFHTPNST
jgi:hypothetical protein